MKKIYSLAGNRYMILKTKHGYFIVAPNNRVSSYWWKDSAKTYYREEWSGNDSYFYRCTAAKAWSVIRRLAEID